MKAARAFAMERSNNRGRHRAEGEADSESCMIKEQEQRDESRRIRCCSCLRSRTASHAWAATDDSCLMLALVCLFPFRFLLFSPRNRVLLVCTELCSLHMQLVSRMKAHCLQEAVDVCEPVAQFPSACLSAQIFQDDRVDNMVGSALFADGSGALVIGAELRDGERPLFEMHRNASVIIPDTIDMMDWILTKSGMSIGLGREIPDASQCDPTATDADSAGKRQQRELPQLHSCSLTSSPFSSLFFQSTATSIPSLPTCCAALRQPTRRSIVASGRFIRGQFSDCNSIAFDAMLSDQG